jgi:flagellar secretion chaperone FliS
MAFSNSYSNYKDTQVKTASPATLILLLYDGVLSNIRKGEVGLQSEEDFVASASYLMKAIAIVSELIGIINPTHAPELAEGLSNSYQIVLNLLTDALKERDKVALNKAFEVMSSLKAAWQEIIEKAEKQAG